MSDRNRWILHIKALRQQHGVGIFEAERLALQDLRWRRWVEYQVNHDPDCRRMALRHMRHHGAAALIVGDGDRLTVR